MLRPTPIPDVPDATARVARAAFPKGTLCMRLRDAFDALYRDEDFAGLYPNTGHPGVPPWRLALVTVFQFLEHLSDRQAAEQVRGRIDWKYALSLELDDPGFNFSVLCEFRARLVAGGQEHLLLDRLLTCFREQGLLKLRGRQRTDSTCVLSCARKLSDIHSALAAREVLPGEHLMDGGYVSGDLIIRAKARHGVEVIGPTRRNSSWQARGGGYDLSAFEIDWEKQQVTCPQGHVSYFWGKARTKQGHPLIEVRFRERTCQTCPVKAQCTRSRFSGRKLNLRLQAQHEAIAAGRAAEKQTVWQRVYARRAGVEGTQSWAVRAMGWRRSRYRGRVKAHVQHVATAAAINLARVAWWLEGRPRGATRTSRFLALKP